MVANNNSHNNQQLSLHNPTITMQATHHQSPKPTQPPRTPPSNVVNSGGRLASNSPSRITAGGSRGGNSYTGSHGGSHTGSHTGSHGGGSLTSRGSNNTRPSSSPEGRSAYSADGFNRSVGSAERNPPSVGSGNAPSVLEGDAANSGADVGGNRLVGGSAMGGSIGGSATAGSKSPSLRPSLAVNTARSPVNNSSHSIPAFSTANNTTAGTSTSSDNVNVNTTLENNDRVATPSKALPRNPKDTAAYVSPGAAGGVESANGAGLGGIASGGGSSPKRRMKQSIEQDFANFGGSNFAGSGGGSIGGGVGMGGGGRMMGGNVSVGGGKSVKSVPTRGAQSPPYGNAVGGLSGYANAGGGAGAIGAVGGPSNSQAHRPHTPGSSPLLNPLNTKSLGTPGSVDSPVGTQNNAPSMPNLHHPNFNRPSPSAAGNVGNPHNGISNPRIPSVGGHIGANVVGSTHHKHSLDDEEQFMFEQRLTQDELGVAIRKISHSGKAQLRYVKCIPLRQPSSSDFDVEGVGVGLGGVGVGGKSLHYLDTASGHLAGGRKQPSDSISVSSKSSTGSRFLERMRSTSSGMRHGIRSMNFGTSTAHVEGRASVDNLLLHNTGEVEKSHRALTWGKKNAVTLSLDKFTCVRKGKTTERTIRNSSPSSRLLSIITVVGTSGGGVGGTTKHESLDIEAPTMLDRDKFASAFARFLGVPLLEEEESLRGRASVAGGAKKKIRTPSLTRRKKSSGTPTAAYAASDAPSTAQSEPALPASSPSAQSTPKVRNRAGTNTSESLLPALTPNSDMASDADRELAFDAAFDDNNTKETIGSTSITRKVSDYELGTPTNNIAAASSKTVLSSSVGSRNNAATSHAGDTATLGTMSESARKRISLGGEDRRESMLEPRSDTPQDGEAIGVGGTTDGEAAHVNGPSSNAPVDNSDNHSHVSSLTGGVDQEIVEELHQAIIELRSELDASRAEAARAVKVAEQAIQSAENCTSSDWNSTVTHKAAEAAAHAQKKSAEAIARARMAEERLAAERKSTSFWRRQAQAAEEEAGSLKTRSAAAGVKQAVMMEELGSERRKAARMFASLKGEFVSAEKKQGDEMTLVQDRKRSLEVELEELKGELERKVGEARRAMEAETERKEKPKGPNRMRPIFQRPRSSSRPRPKNDSVKRSESASPIPPTPEEEAANERITTLQSEVTALRKQFELVRHTSMDEILLLHRQSEEWSSQASRAVAASTAETDYLREKLAAESAMRLKLLNELQDIRGTVRVYCRPKPPSATPGSGKKTKSILQIPTHDILVLNEDTSAMSFKYDRVFSPGASQYEVFSELEEPLISSLDGFNVTLLTFGQGGSGKTHTLLGEVTLDGETEDGILPSIKTYGVQLQAIQQLFTIAGHRTDRYKDAFSMTMVEVHNEKLFDLVAGTPLAEQGGEMVVCETRDRREKRSGSRQNNEGPDNSNASLRKGKLEIRTNIDGNTVVQGLVSIPIESFEDAISIWQESISHRSELLGKQGSDWKKHERKSNVITTVHITSVNIATGVGTEGKLQFVDMAASDICHGAKKVRDDSSLSNAIIEEDATQFANKSIDAFNDVINARCQFDRSVPYRNSTLTHLLRDSLEADTKVLLMCCVSSDEAHLADTVGALRFANRMQKVSIGKATKHIVGGKEGPSRSFVPVSSRARE